MIRNYDFNCFSFLITKIQPTVQKLLDIYTLYSSSHILVRLQLMYLYDCKTVYSCSYLMVTLPEVVSSPQAGTDLEHSPSLGQALGRVCCGGHSGNYTGYAVIVTGAGQTQHGDIWLEVNSVRVSTVW